MEFNQFSAITTQFRSQAVASIPKEKVAMQDYGQPLGEIKAERDSETEVSISAAAFKRLTASKASTPKIKIEVDKDSNHIVVNVVDPESGEVIRRIPDEKFQALAERIDDFQRLFLEGQK